LAQIIDNAAGDLAKAGFIIAPDQLLSKAEDVIDRLLHGKAIVNSLLPHRNQLRTADPVVLARGEFERTVGDLQVSGAGMDFGFLRPYRSGAGLLGPLGPSWDHAYNKRLVQQDYFTVFQLSGRLKQFRFLRHPQFEESLDFKYYLPPDGLHSVLVESGNGSFLIKSREGNTEYYEAAPQPNEHRIQRIEDRYGNHLSFIYSDDDLLRKVLINSESRYVEFEYEDYQLNLIRDHTGRTVHFSYDDWGYLERAS